MIELGKVSATEILRLIEAGKVTSRQGVEHFIHVIKKENPSLNAVVISLFEQALREADHADSLYKDGKRTGRLHGLPFTIKECFDLPKTPSTFGLLRRKDDIPTTTDIYVHALQKEGAIVIGKTNVAQLLATIESQNPVYGATNNPYSLRHTSGGSSGGEGAIIAAGGSPIGLGTDIGGSIRIPATFNGICGIKPTAERTLDKSRLLDRDLALPVKSVTGILANHAEDLSLFLHIMNESNGSKKVTLESFREVDLSKLKVGYMLTDTLFDPMEVIQDKIKESIKVLNSLGVETTLFQPPDPLKAEALYTKILSFDQLAIFAENLKDDKPIKLLKGFFLLAKMPKWLLRSFSFIAGLLGQRTLKRALYNFGSKADLIDLETGKANYTNQYLKAMDNSPIGKLDAILCPAFALPAILHNTADRIGLGGTYTIQHNITGFPAGVASLAVINEEEALSRKFSPDIIMQAAAKNEKQAAGLPIGVQIAARPWNDHIVIALIDKLHRNLNPK